MTRIYAMLRLTLVLLTFWTSACDPPVPEWVWIPSPEFKAALEVWVGDDPGQTFRVAQWISLHAARSTGPWQRVPYKDLPADARWLRRPPEAREKNVEANVRWQSEPSGHAEFNLPKAREILVRKVRFSKPGRYKIWAESQIWGGAIVESNVLELSVEP